MGKVVVTARLENLEDVYKVSQGTLPTEQVRTAEVTDALIDTGATGLLVPRSLIAQLGLSLLRTRPARTIAQFESPAWPIIEKSAAGKQIATQQCLTVEHSKVQIENQNIGEDQVKG